VVEPLTSVGVVGFLRTATPHQEIEVGAFACLQDVFNIERQPTTIGKGQGCPVCTAGRERIIVDFEAQHPLGNI
jgi:hypothetical protein